MQPMDLDKAMQCKPYDNKSLRGQMANLQSVIHKGKVHGNKSTIHAYAYLDHIKSTLHFKIHIVNTEKNQASFTDQGPALRVT